MTNKESLLLARQPILDKSLQVVGYELLCRPAPEDSLSWQAMNGDSATSNVMISAFNDIGIDEVTGGLPAFINFTEHWLHNPPILPAVNMVAEVLEYIEPTDNNLQAIRRLKRYGYTVALDDYQGDPTQAAIIELADIVKIDIRRLPSLTTLTDIINRYSRPELTWLAEKVETQEEFQQCLEAGCELFQGYFFSRPADVYGKRLPDNQLAVLQLLHTLNDPNSEVEQITAIMQTDPQLSYKLLRIVNSAAVGLPREVTSIARAVVIVGIDRLRAWANLISLGQLADKPSVLREQAIIRAYLCKSITLSWPDLDEDTAFTMGLFSLLDAFLDYPLDSICRQLNLPDYLTEALLEHRGGYGLILDTVIAMERAQWDDINWPVLAGMKITPTDLEMRYLSAIHTTRDLLISET